MSIAAARSLAIGAVVSIAGVVTAEAGRLGTPPLIAIADATGGVVVRLPAGSRPLARGMQLEIQGKLADPYGQLEIRPTTGGILVRGSAALPTPTQVPLGGLEESTEGRLSVLTGRLRAQPTKSSGGDVTVRLEIAPGVEVRVMADSSSGVKPAAFAKGATYRVTGVVGQRASRKGALDGYRLWARDRADIVLIAGPVSSGSPDPSGSSGPGSTTDPSAAAPRVSTIAAALGHTNRDVVVEAVVTAGASLLDTTGRRIVVQDPTGAVEVLLPRDASPPPVGERVRMGGRMGAAYGSPRLRATSMARIGTGARPATLVIHGALIDAHAWRLVAVSGRVEDVRKLGDRWRAEIRVGAHRIQVVGQPGAGIPVASIVEGRAIQVVGIVRRAYPGASDRRPSLLPRSPSDIDVAAGDNGSSTPVATAGRGPSGGPLLPDGDADAAGGPDVDAVPNVDLAELAAVVGSTVRVGGLVEGLVEDGFRLDDGTAIGRVTLTGEALGQLPLIEPGDAVNVIGVVGPLDDGTLAVAVADPAAIVLGSHPLADRSSSPAVPASPGSGGAVASSAAGALVAGLGDDLGGFPGAGAGIASLVAISLLSLVVTMVRRRHARAMLASRVAVRLAAFVTPSEPSPEARSGRRSVAGELATPGEPGPDEGAVLDPSVGRA